jgi:hypothetical protein
VIGIGKTSRASELLVFLGSICEDTMSALLLTFVFFIGHRDTRNPPNWKHLTVKGCSGEIVPLFWDAKMAIPMANPLVTDFAGSYKFYTPSKCVKIEDQSL